MKIIHGFARIALPVLLGVATASYAARPGSQPDAQGGGTSSTVRDDLFNGTEKFAANASDVTEITQDPSTLGMVHGHNSDRARRTVLSVVRTYSYDKPGMYKIEDVEEFRKRLNTGDWHCSVHTRDMKRGESTDICNRARTDGLVESAIITVEPKELTFIHTIVRSNEDGKDVPRVPTAPMPGGGAQMYLAPGMDTEALRLAITDAVRRSSDAMRSPGFEVNMARMQAEMPAMEARMAAQHARMMAQEAREAAREAEREAEGKESPNSWVMRYAAPPASPKPTPAPKPSPAPVPPPQH